MKRLFYAITLSAVSAAILSSCGTEKNDNTMVVEQNDNGIYVVETKTPTERKVKEILTQTTAAEQSAKSTETAAKSAEKRTDNEKTAVAAVDDEAAEETEPVRDNSEESAEEIPTEIEREEYFLEGVVYRKSAQNILIKEKDLSLLSIGFKDKSVIDSISLGDEVRVSYDGIIMESYPGQVHKANGAEVVSKAVYEGKIKHFICEASELPQSFTVLLPDGWTIKEIDYPKDGEFTDWGYRIVPKGENNGLDISWHSSFSVRERYDIFPDTFNGCAVKKYGSDGEWRFYTYDNGYIAANNFYKTDKYEEYKDEFEFILNTLIFGQTEFIGD